jgi:hypothetical protein
MLVFDNFDRMESCLENCLENCLGSARGEELGEELFSVFALFALFSVLAKNSLVCWRRWKFSAKLRANRVSSLLRRVNRVLLNLDSPNDSRLALACLAKEVSFLVAKRFFVLT